MSEDVIIRRKIGINEEAQLEYSSYSGSTLTSQFTVKPTADGLIYKILATHTDEFSAVTDLYSIGSNGTFMFGSTDLASDSTLAEFKSTDKAILFPRLDIADVTTPTDGHVAYDTVSGKFKFREAGSWTTIGAGGTIYTANEIVYGDGSTIGGVTSSALTFDGTVLNVASNGTAGGWGKYQFKVQSSSTEAGIIIQNSGTGGRVYSIISTSNASGIGGGMLSIGDATSSQNLLMFDASHVLYLPVLTSNGFLKTTGSNGQVTIDTTTYISDSLTAAYIILGNASNIATPTQVTGDITISNTGVTAIGTNKVANSMMAQMPALSLKGNATNATANPANISAGSDHQVMRRSGTAIAFGSINLASSDAVGSSLLGLTNGGLNTDLSAGGAVGDVLYAATSTTFTRLAAVASGNVLISNGVGVAPSWSATLPITSVLIQGTAGNGYVELLAQSSAPAVGSSTGFRLYAGSTGGLNWIRKNGTDVYVRTLSATLTADRTWTLPDTTGTIALLNGSQTFTSATWNGTVIAGQYGGTGVANNGMTITLGASIATTGTLTPTLAFPTGGSATYTFPLSSATLLANNLGLSGGTTLVGDTASGGNLNLISTSNATKGNILLGTLMVYSQANNWLALGAANDNTVKTPAYTLDVSVGSSSSNNRLASFILTDGISPNTGSASYAGYFDNQNSSNISSSGTYGIYAKSRAADGNSGRTYGVYGLAFAGQLAYGGYFQADGNSNTNRTYHALYATTGGYSSTGSTASAIQGHITTSAATSTKVMILNLGYSGTKTSSEFLIDGQDNGTSFFSVRGNGDMYTSGIFQLTNGAAYSSYQSTANSPAIYGFSSGGQAGSLVIQGRSTSNNSGVFIVTGSTPTTAAFFGNTGFIQLGSNAYGGTMTTAGLAITSANATSSTTSVSIAGTVIQQTVTAGANSQVMYGMYFRPTFSAGAFTGTSSIALTLLTSAGNNILAATDAGAITLGYTGGTVGISGATTINVANTFTGNILSVQKNASNVFIIDDTGKIGVSTTINSSFSITAANGLKISNGDIHIAASGTGAIFNASDSKPVRFQVGSATKMAMNTNGVFFGNGTNPVSTIHNNGSLTEDAITTVSASSYTILSTDHYVYATFSGTTTITLPQVSSVNIGKLYMIYAENGCTITLTRGGADTINNATTYTINPNTGIVLHATASGKWCVYG